MNPALLADEQGLVLIALVGGCLAIAVGLLLFALFGTGAAERQLARRLDAAQSRRDSAAVRAAKTLSLRRDTSDSSIKQIDSLVKRWLPQRERLRERLQATGLGISTEQFLLASFAVTLAVALAFALLTPLPPGLAVLAGVAFGLMLPHLTVSVLGSMRQGQFTTLFPEAIDLIVRGLRSGLPITESIGTVSREIADPVASEFRQIAQSIQFGRTLEQAMWEANARIGTQEFKFFVITLSLQRETGGNLAETLENLSDILRKRRQMKQKIKAMSSEARASAMIIGSLPFIMAAILYLINPDYITTLITDRRGWLLIGAGALSQAVGIGVMVKLVKFEI